MAKQKGKQKKNARSQKAVGKKPKVSKSKPKIAKRHEPASTKRKAVPNTDRLDLSKFPAESVTQMERGICLACVWEVFTRHLKLAPKTAADKK